MNGITKESTISMLYMEEAYYTILEVVKKEINGVIANPQIIPINFNVNFFSFYESKTTISVVPVNGEFQSKLEQMKRNGYANMNYSFRIHKNESIAKGLLRIKIIDLSFVKKEKKYSKPPDPSLS